jgi:hypothetical protein
MKQQQNTTNAKNGRNANHSRTQATAETPIASWMLKTAGMPQQRRANNVNNHEQNGCQQQQDLSIIRTQTTAYELKAEGTPATTGISTTDETQTLVGTPGTEGMSTAAGSSWTQHNSMKA